MGILGSLFKLFTGAEKREIIVLQIFVILISFIEVVGFSSLAPFIAFIGDPTVIHNSDFTEYLYKTFKFSSETQFIVFWGVMASVLIIVSNILIMLREYINTGVLLKLYRNMSIRLMHFYLNKGYLFHAQMNSNKLIGHFDQLRVIIEKMLFSLLNGVGRAAVVLFFLGGIILVDPFLGLFLNFGMGAIYVAFFYYFRKLNIKSSHDVSKAAIKNFKILSESFLGIKDILIENLGNVFTDRYQRNLEQNIKGKKTHLVIGIAPRYIVEGLLFASITLIILFLFIKKGETFATIISKLSFVAIAGYKIMPKISDLYLFVTAFQGCIAPLEALSDDLVDSKKENWGDNSQSNSVEPLEYANNVSLEHISFGYSESKQVLENVNLCIRKNRTIGIVGATGTGKTTLVNILLGLIQPENGHIAVDGKPVEHNSIERYKMLVGYVPQDIFLLDNTIERNVAFGIDSKEIDRNRVIEVLKMSALWEHVARMEKGIDTVIGESGTQLSGGQRQRLGIARALFRGAEILVFDEATSSLDTNTERQIMQAIKKISHKKTIIIVAHRINTLQQADSIIVLHGGRIRDEGTFNELKERDSFFRSLAGIDF